MLDVLDEELTEASVGHSLRGEGDLGRGAEGTERTLIRR